jgi:hypothetical protein
MRDESRNGRNLLVSATTLVHHSTYVLCGEYVHIVRSEGGGLVLLRLLLSTAGAVVGDTYSHDLCVRDPYTAPAAPRCRLLAAGCLCLQSHSTYRYCSACQRRRRAYRAARQQGDPIPPPEGCEHHDIQYTCKTPKQGYYTLYVEWASFPFFLFSFFLFFQRRVRYSWFNGCWFVCFFNSD